MEFIKVQVPEELALLPINEQEEIRRDCEVTDEDKLIYVCRGQDD